jgi:tryptophanyl-tRNA synthetase
MGYGHAKQALYELVLENFKTEREKFNFYNDQPETVEKALTLGAEKAAHVADEVLIRVRKKLGY